MTVRLLAPSLIAALALASACGSKSGKSSSTPPPGDTGTATGGETGGGTGPATGGTGSATGGGTGPATGGTGSATGQGTGAVMPTTPVVTVVDGVAEQQLVLGQTAQPLKLAEAHGRAVTWSKKGYGHPELKIDAGVVTFDASALTPSTWGYPKTFTSSFVARLADGSESTPFTVVVVVGQTVEQECAARGVDHAVVNGKCWSRPASQAYLATDATLTSGVIGQGDQIAIDLDIDQNDAGEEEIMDYVVENATCEGVFDVRKVPSGNHTYSRLYATSKFTTPAGTVCEGRLFTTRKGLKSSESRPVKVRVAAGKRFYGYCVGEETSPAIENTVKALRSESTWQTELPCGDAARLVRGLKSVNLKGVEGARAFDLAPLEGLTLLSFTVKDAELVGNSPSFEVERYLAIERTNLAKLAGLEKTTPRVLSLLDNTFANGSEAVAALEGMGGLARLYLGFEVTPYNIIDADVARCSADGSGLPRLPAFDGLAALDALKVCEPFAYDLVLKATPDDARKLRELALERGEVKRLALEGISLLETLELPHTVVTNARLSKLPKLKSLALTIKAASEPVFTVDELGALETLHARLPEGAWPNGLGNLTALRELLLEGAPLYGSIVDDVVKLAGTLEVLRLHVDYVSSERAARFKDMTSLRSLSLKGTDGTDWDALALPDALASLAISGGKKLDVAKLPLAKAESLALSNVGLEAETTLTALIAALKSGNRAPFLRGLTLANLKLAVGEASLEGHGLGEVTALRVPGNNLGTLAWIAPFTGLKTLDATGIQGDAVNVKDLTPLAGHATLTHLTLGAQGFTSLAPLVALPNLTALDFAGSPVGRTEAECPTTDGPLVLRGRCIQHRQD